MDLREQDPSLAHVDQVDQASVLGDKTSSANTGMGVINICGINVYGRYTYSLPSLSNAGSICIKYIVVMNVCVSYKSWPCSHEW